MDRLRIGDAFPGALDKQYPIVRADYTLLTVLYLLRMKDVDAVPIIPITRKGARAVFGFSSLPQFMNLGPEAFANLLRHPCETASDELAVLSIEDDVSILLRAFRSRRLGFALIHDGGGSGAGLVSLADAIALYGRRILQTDMTVADVGTPIFSMPASTSIGQALKAMFRHRYRRVFLEGERAYISDRSVMNYLFSPIILEGLGQGEPRKGILSASIDRVAKFSPPVIDPGTSLKAAASKLARDRGGCLVTSDGRVVTPWDTVMKPWISGRLTIR